MSKVLCMRSRYETIHDDIKQLAAIQPPEELARQPRIVIKINLCDARTADTGATTHPAFLDALLAYLRDVAPAADIAVVESDGITVLADHYIKWFGVHDILCKHQARYVNLTQDEVTEVPINGRHLRTIAVPKVFQDAFYISFAKLKTNLLPTITGALKNQFGCLPMVEKFKFHDDLDNVIHDVNLAIRPNLSIVDGILAHGGIQGPSFGTPIRADLILAGKDAVAVDAAMAHVLGYNPRRVGQIRKCWKSGIGDIHYELVGAPLPRIDFENHRFESAVFQLGSRVKRMYQKADRPAHARAH